VNMGAGGGGVDCCILLRCCGVAEKINMGAGGGGGERVLLCCCGVVDTNVNTGGGGGACMCFVVITLPPSSSDMQLATVCMPLEASTDPPAAASRHGHHPGIGTHQPHSTASSSSRCPIPVRVADSKRAWQGRHQAPRAQAD
jgi:hypothetical protein